MAALAPALQSIQWSLLLIAAMVAFGFVFMTLVSIVGFHRLGQMVRDSHQDLEQISKQIAQDAVLLREAHALTAKASAALDNVARLVVYPGRRPT